MARLGIDFGTTNTVAVMHDRGLFSVVLHQARTSVGTIVQEAFPSSILVEDSGRKYFGLDADRRFAQIGASRGAVFIPSLKRQLRDYADGRTIGCGAADSSERAETETHEPYFDPAELLIEFLRALADSIRQSQTLGADEPLETVITWPANANGAQRHVTRKAFREAGFVVSDSLNEPTASAIELADWLTAHREQKQPASAVAVFDLGGGTFDASVICMKGSEFRVLASAGIEELGGDDFDHALLEMLLKKLQPSSGPTSGLTRHALLRHARSQKEIIGTGTAKSLFLNPADFALKGRAVSIPVEAFYECIRPMLMPAVSTLRQVIESATTKQPAIDPQDPESLVIYLVGGSSKLPLVAAMVRDAYPRCRVVLSDKPFRSVAMGAAICATDQVTHRDVFARHFGLIRLKDDGNRETFDTIFPAGTPIPRRDELPLEKVAWYRPAHNIGHLKYLECASIGPDGMPTGEGRAWNDILFPYDPGRPLSAPCSARDIVTTDYFAQEPVCEVYRCDADGVITVELRRPSHNDSRRYEICRD